MGQYICLTNQEMWCFQACREGDCLTQRNLEYVARGQRFRAASVHLYPQTIHWDGLHSCFPHVQEVNLQFHCSLGDRHTECRVSWEALVPLCWETLHLSWKTLGTGMGSKLTGWLCGKSFCCNSDAQLRSSSAWGKRQPRAVCCLPHYLLWYSRDNISALLHGTDYVLPPPSLKNRSALYNQPRSQM